MANLYVYSGAGGTASGADWTNAYLTLGAATAVATNADTIYIASDHNETPGTTAKTFTLPTSSGLRIISSDRTSGTPPTTATAGAIVSIGAGSVAMAINGFGYCYGVTFKGATNNSASCVINVGTSSANPGGLVFDSCVFELQTVNASARIDIGAGVASTTDDSFVRFINPQFKFAATGQKIGLNSGRIEAFGMTLGGTAPTTLFSPRAAAQAKVDIHASDLTGVTWTNLAEWVASAGPVNLNVIQCKLPASYVRFTGTPPEEGGPQIWISDCSSGDTHGIMEFESALGSCVTDTSRYWTTGAAGQSWKITTTSACSLHNPFRTPWISLYNTGTTSVTPYINILRNGDSSTTAYDNDEVFGEFLVKDNAGFTNSTRYTDSVALLGTPAAQATSGSTSDWTGDSGSAWFGKVDTGAAVTPDEAGYIMGRVNVCIAIAGYLYVDPQIRT